MEEKPFEDRYVPRAEVDWGRSWWWWHPLTRAIHPAMRITSLITGVLGILTLSLGVQGGRWLFAPRLVENLGQYWNFGRAVSLPLVDAEIGQARLFATLGLREFAFLTFCLFWVTAVMGLFGAIIARRAAVELGQRTIAPWGETLRLVGSRWLSVIGVTGMHVVALVILLALPFVLGLIARIGPLVAVVGVVLLLLLPLVWVVGRLVISMFACFPLAVAAITVEKKADAFEGFSRSNACLFQRPVLFAALFLALAAVGWVGYQIVYWLFLAGWHWTRDAFLSGAGLSISEILDVRDAAASGRLQRLAPWITAGGALARLLVDGYLFSYFWSAAAAMYLILRKSVYNAELDDIDTLSTLEPSALPTLPAAPVVSSQSAAPAESSAAPAAPAAPPTPAAAEA
jgi:hypothetical protein